MEEVIKVKSLSKTYRRMLKQGILKDMFAPKFEMVKAVKNISFSIKKGESVAFLGPNGAGKTTTIKMLAGLMYKSSGDVEVLGFEPFKREKEYLKQIGLVMGNKTGLNWDLTPNQSFELISKIYQIPKLDFENRLKELTELLSAKEFLNTQVRKLSLGERMKMELIGSILHNPKVLFLDEPTIGLDILSKQKIREFLREIQRKYKVTMILTSHDMNDIERVSDRVIIINKGEIVYDNSITALTEKYNNKKNVKIIFKGKNGISFEDKIVDAKITESSEHFVIFEVTKVALPKFVSYITEKYYNNIMDIDILSVSLEEIVKDIFVSTMQKF